METRHALHMRLLDVRKFSDKSRQEVNLELTSFRLGLSINFDQCFLKFLSPLICPSALTKIDPPPLMKTDPPV